MTYNVLMGTLNPTNSTHSSNLIPKYCNITDEVTNFCDLVHMAEFWKQCKHGHTGPYTEGH